MARLRRQPRISDRPGITSLAEPVTLRLAAGDDTPSLQRLAQRDSRPLPPGPHLVAVRDGAIAAALSLATGELIADPFQRTAELRALLSCHAGERRAGRTRTRASGTAELKPALAVA
jgi:hypothetical protein